MMKNKWDKNKLGDPAVKKRQVVLVPEVVEFLTEILKPIPVTYKSPERDYIKNAVLSEIMEKILYAI